MRRHGGRSEASVGPDLGRAALSQKGQSLIASIWTKRAVPLAAFDRAATARRRAQYLCLSLAGSGHGPERRLCFGGRAAHHLVGLLAIDASGKTTKAQTIAARVRRPAPKHLVLTVLPAAAGLAPQRYHWRVLELRGRCGRAVGDCESSLPAAPSARVFRLRPVRPVGCTGDNEPGWSPTDRGITTSSP